MRWRSGKPTTPAWSTTVTEALHAEQRLHVCELFYSIQGESTRAGLPCLFIRLSGCNLRCSYCDAAYTWDDRGRDYTAAELLAWVRAQNCPLVELTGGEPLLQEPVYALMEALVAADFRVLLETNGSIALERVPPRVGVIVDVKCPGSAMAAHWCDANLELLRRRALLGSSDEIKFVLSGPQDFHWAMDFLAHNRLAGLLPILFSPVQPQFPPKELAELMLRHHSPARLQLQLHSLLWPGQRRGV